MVRHESRSGKKGRWKWQAGRWDLIKPRLVNEGRFALDICRHLVVSRTTTARSRPGTAVGFSHGPPGMEYMGKIIGDGFYRLSSPTPCGSAAAVKRKPLFFSLHGWCLVVSLG